MVAKKKKRVARLTMGAFKCFEGPEMRYLAAKLGLAKGTALYQAKHDSFARMIVTDKDNQEAFLAYDLESEGFLSLIEADQPIMRPVAYEYLCGLQDALNDEEEQLPSWPELLAKHTTAGKTPSKEDTQDAPEGAPPEAPEGADEDEEDMANRPKPSARRGRMSRRNQAETATSAETEAAAPEEEVEAAPEAAAPEAAAPKRPRRARGSRRKAAAAEPAEVAAEEPSEPAVAPEVAESAAEATKDRGAIAEAMSALVKMIQEQTETIEKLAADVAGLQASIAALQAGQTEANDLHELEAEFREDTSVILSCLLYGLYFSVEVEDQASFADGDAPFPTLAEFIDHINPAEEEDPEA